MVVVLQYTIARRCFHNPRSYRSQPSQLGLVGQPGSPSGRYHGHLGSLRSAGHSYGSCATPHGYGSCGSRRRRGYGSSCGGSFGYGSCTRPWAAGCCGTHGGGGAWCGSGGYGGRECCSRGCRPMSGKHRRRGARTCSGGLLLAICKGEVYGRCTAAVDRELGL